MKIDFIHLGYHKTASTWFQLFGYGNHPDIFLLNDPKSPRYKIFMNEFVYPDDFKFCHDKFYKRISKTNIFTSKKLTGICEENLTGNFWTGRNSDTLLNRISNHFSEPKIILCIREQRSMFTSLYLNYIKHGGNLSASKLVNEPCFDGFLIFDKLKYSNYLTKLYNLFDSNNILIYTYEEFLNYPDIIYCKICNFLGIKSIHIQNKRVNHSRGLITLQIERILNKLGYHNRYTKKAFDICSQFDLRVTNISSVIPQQTLSEWSKCNDLITEITALELKKFNYL